VKPPEAPSTPPPDLGGDLKPSSDPKPAVTAIENFVQNSGPKPSPIHDRGWFDFRQELEKTSGLQWSEPDWADAWQFEWKRMGIELQWAAIDGIRARKGTQDAALRTKPINYLKQRMWQRTVDRGFNGKPQTREQTLPEWTPQTIKRMRSNVG
jgi:hypothetical protein